MPSTSETSTGLREGSPPTTILPPSLTIVKAERVVARFLYFRFIMALVRIKDIERRGW